MKRRHGEECVCLCVCVCVCVCACKGLGVEGSNSSLGAVHPSVLMLILFLS